jgi:hypothetical protein
MRTTLAGLLLFCFACSSSSSPATAKDAGLDATADADDAACFPFCGSAGHDSGEGDDGGDAAMSCAQLKSEVQTLETPARACNPQSQNQCSGVAQGPCCPITVTGGNDQAVNTFQQAVNLYKAQCDAGCIPIMCPSTPSDECVGGTQASQGSCQ